jgi:PAS domain S-box-containing protein
MASEHVSRIAAAEAEDTGTFSGSVDSNTALAEQLQRVARELESLRRETERTAVLGGQERSLLESLLRHSPHGIVVCDRDGRLLVQSAAAERIWGGSASAGSLSDWTRYRAYHPDGRPYTPDDWAMAKAMRSGEPLGPCDLRIERFDGSTAHLLCSAAPIFSDDGGIAGAMAVFVDVTELRELQRRLATREAEVLELSRKHADRGARLLLVSTALSSALTADEVGRVVLERAVPALGAHTGALLLLRRQPAPAHLEVIAAVGYPDPVLASIRHIQLEDGLPVCEVATRGRPIFLDNSSQSLGRYPGLREIVGGIGVSALAVVPLLQDGAVVGALAFHFHHPHPISQEERELAQALADQCAQALERVQLYQSERRARQDAEAAQAQTELLYHLADAVSRAQTLDDIYAPALHAVATALGVERASILLFDENGKMRFRAWRGLSPDYRAAVDGHSPWKADESAAAPILVEDVYTDPALAAFRPVFDAEGIRSLAFFPICAGTTLLGKFMVYSGTPRRLHDREVQLTLTIASHVSQAVARQRLLSAERAARRQAEEHAETARRLHQITGRLSNALLPDQVAEVILDEAGPAMAADAVGLWTIDVTGTRLQLLRARGYAGDGRGLSMPLDSDFPVAECVRNRQPIFIENPADYRQAYPRSERLAREHGYRSDAGVCLPLAIENRALGCLTLTFSRPRDFDAAQRTLLLTLAQHCAQGLERARLYEAERRARAEAEDAHQRSALLARAASLVGTSQDPDVLLEKVAELMVPARADLCMLHVVDDDGVLRLATLCHLDAARTQAARRLVTDAPGRSGERSLVATVLNRETLWVSGRGGEAPIDELMGRLDMHSAIVAPLVVGDRTLGTLVLMRSPGSPAYSAADMQFGDDLAGRVAVALDSARLLRAQARLHAQAEAASRAKDEFISLLGHELRNPLSPIVTALELMRLRGGGEDEGGQFARERGVIERQVQHLVRLVDDLLDVSRITRGKVELRKGPVRVVEVVGKAIEMVSPLFEQRQHHLAVSVPGELVVQADEARLAQVLANLLTNAAKYTDAGGHVDISARTSDGELEIRVSDDGRGMSRELLPRVFELFVQGQGTAERLPDRAEGGLGLGLAIVKSLVELHGGRVVAESPGPGRGSTFVLRLPQVEASAAASRHVEESEPAPRAHALGRRVLVVDDNEDAADFLAEALTTIGHEVAVAYDGPTALDRAQQFHPELAVLDIGLPVMDGYELAHRLRALPGMEEVTLLALTGYGQESDRARAFAEGFQAHFTKPLDLQRLCDALEAL